MDANGQTATGYTGTVTFTSSDAYPGLLPPDYTFTSSDKGIHAFVVSLFTAGTQTLTVEDAADRSISGNATVVVQAEKANHFLIAAPSTAVSGTPFDVTVTAVDPFGNVDTNYTGTITFTSSDSDPGVGLPADYTFQATDNGTHTFPAGIVLVTPGEQTITTTDVANGITGSVSVTVDSGPAAPPAASARRPSSPSPNFAGGPAQTNSTAQAFVAVDWLFASVVAGQPGFPLLHAGRKGL